MEWFLFTIAILKYNASIILRYDFLKVLDRLEKIQEEALRKLEGRK
jgi:hypothetical protein